MSWFLILLYVVSAVFVFSQIGGKLTARNALTWLLVFTLLGFAVFSPGRLLPLAQALGVQLVSNLLFAGLLLFLMFQSMQESAFTTRIARRIRDLVSTLGAEQWQGPHEGVDRTLVIVPCFNEHENLGDLLGAIEAFRKTPEGERVDFCIVDDGSWDGSRGILRGESASRALAGVVLLPTNVGVSAVTLTGFKIAIASDYARVAQVDADGQHPLEALPSLIRCQAVESADLVIGSRFLEGRKRDPSTTPARVVGSFLLELALRLFRAEARITDPTSGFRVYSRRAVALLLTRMPDEYPEPESIALLLSAGMRIREVSVRMLPRVRGVSSLAGLRGPKFMLKVFGSLVGLRLRSWMR